MADIKKVLDKIDPTRIIADKIKERWEEKSRRNDLKQEMKEEISQAYANEWKIAKIEKAKQQAREDVNKTPFSRLAKLSKMIRSSYDGTTAQEYDRWSRH